MSGLIDTHAHLFLKEFDNDRDETVSRAQENGIEKIVLPNVDLSTIQDMINLSNKFPQICKPAIGIHPSSITKSYKEDLKKIVDLASQKQFCAIGEIGIDLYWDKTYKNEQIKAFEFQINLALENKLPVIIHNRDAFDEIMQVLNNFNGLGLTGIFH